VGSKWDWLWIAGVAGGALALGPGGGYAQLTAGPAQQAAILVQAQKWGAAFGVPVDWIMAIAKIESAFRPGAKNLSSAGDVKRGGAWGAMQVTLATAQGIAPALNAHPSASVRETMKKWTGRGEDLLAVDLGVLFGAFLLAKLTAEFKDFPTVAAAYNRGAGNVRKMIAAKKTPGAVAYAVKAEAAREALA